MASFVKSPMFWMVIGGLVAMLLFGPAALMEMFLSPIGLIGIVALLILSRRKAEKELFSAAPDSQGDHDQDAEAL